MTNEALQHIPLNKLAAWDGNVRKTGADTGLTELAAPSAAQGLLQICIFATLDIQNGNSLTG